MDNTEPHNRLHTRAQHMQNDALQAPAAATQQRDALLGVWCAASPCLNHHQPPLFDHNL
jgi:hypothetical protein